MRSTLLALFLGLFALGACGDVQVRTFRLDLDNPSSEAGALPLRLGVVRGRAVEAADLRVIVTDEDGATYEFQVVPGTTLAFAAEAQALAAPVVLSGEGGGPSPEESLARVRERFADLGLPVKVREPAKGTAFLVELEDDREDTLAEIVSAATANADLRFLIEVRPTGQYRPWRDGRRVPRLEGASPPWSGTPGAFEAFKKTEVAVWQEALEASKPYRPSDERYLVLPRQGTDAAEVGDFAVLEWPAEARFRLDQRILENPIGGRDAVHRPAIFYDIRPEHREAFEAFTAANLGLPMAIVTDWVVVTAPVLNAPLSDRVQITLGSGPMAQLEADAERLVRALQSEGPILATHLVATARWGRDGAFEVWVPLPETGEIRVGVEARDPANERRLEASIPLRFVPGAPTNAKQSVRAAVAEILLDRIAPKEAAPPLRAYLPESVTELATLTEGDAPLARRVVAVDLLGRVDAASGDARAALLEALRAPEPELRLTAATALARLPRNPAQLGALEEAVGDSDVSVRRAAVAGLARVGGNSPDTIRALLVAGATDDRATREAAQSALHALLPEARSTLEKAAREGEPGLRAAAIRVFALQEDQEAVDLLVDFLGDPVDRVRLAALGSLSFQAQMRPQAVETHVEAVAKRLGDTDDRVRANAAVTLRLVGTAAVPAVLSVLKDGGEGARVGALLALAQMEALPPAALDDVRKAASDPAGYVRLVAAWALSRHGEDRDALLPAALREALGAEAGAREFAATVVWMQAPEMRDLAPRLLPLLDDETEDVRVYAASALERMGEPSERTKAILAPAREDPSHRLHFVAIFDDED